MTEKKTKRFDMRLPGTTLEKLKMLAFSEGVSMSQYVEMLILTAWDNQITIDDFVAYMSIIP